MPPRLRGWYRADSQRNSLPLPEWQVCSMCGPRAPWRLDISLCVVFHIVSPQPKMHVWSTSPCLCDAQFCDGGWRPATTPCAKGAFSNATGLCSLFEPPPPPPTLLLCNGGLTHTHTRVKGQRLPRQAPTNGPGCSRQPQHTRGCNYAHLTYHQHRQPPSDGDPNPRSPSPPQPHGRRECMWMMMTRQW